MLSNRRRRHVRWLAIALSLAFGIAGLMVSRSAGIGSALCLVGGVVQLLFEVRRHVPLVIPRRRKPIIIERLRYPHG